MEFVQTVHQPWLFRWMIYQQWRMQGLIKRFVFHLQQQPWRETTLQLVLVLGLFFQVRQQLRVQITQVQQ